MVTEDGEYGVTIRRREQYFTFDREVYRAWSGGQPSGWTTMTAMTADFSRMTATAVIERSAGARWIPGTAVRVLI